MRSQRFLSCLYGSERWKMGRWNFLTFLSCLYGSEQRLYHR
ncbi:hypothetical protein AS4_17850 [Acinetobacter guillouiae]|nr:hypothetical protein AS4_17850 [Acinetobacter guillouiae]